MEHLETIDTFVLKGISEVFTRLTIANVRYCHWKSNFMLDDALSGKTDLDLLVFRDDATKFEEVVSGLDFKRGTLPWWYRNPSIVHYFGLDEETGKLIHLHVYFRIVTGGFLMKNHRLPLERILLNHCVSKGGVPVPEKSAELLVLVLKTLIEYGSFAELPFALRQTNILRTELIWLCCDENLNRALELLQQFFPFLDEKLFREGVDALRGSSLTQRFWVGTKIRNIFSGFRIYRSWVAFLMVLLRLLMILGNRLFIRRKIITPSAGGVVLAFVGGDGAGKSSIVAGISDWLGEHFDIYTVHAGKPPTTWLSSLPNLILPMLRKLFPFERINVQETRGDDNSRPKNPRDYSLLLLFRSVLVAFDQRSVLKNAFAKAGQGAIVICDRFPSAILGGTDGPRVDPAWYSHPLKKWLANMEKRIYASIQPPDQAFVLTVPVEVALKRNDQRAGTEGEAYVRTRHADVASWVVPNCKIHRLENTQPLVEALKDFKRLVWQAL